MRRSGKRTRIGCLFALCLSLILVFNALGFYPAAAYAEQSSDGSLKQGSPSSAAYLSLKPRVTATDLPEGFTLSETINNDPREIAEQSRYVAYFTHEFRRAPASIELEVRTALEYRKLKAGQFTFRLMDGAHKFISTAVNDASGKVVFDRIEYTEPGTYIYFITEEEDTEDDEIIYDRGERIIKVNVVTNPTGAPGLIATPDYDPNDDSTIPLFSNSVNTDTGLGLRCLINGGTPATEGRQFGFTVEFDFQDGDGVERDFAWMKAKPGSSGEPPKVIGQGRISSGGTFTLGHNEIFIVPELPFGTSYKIKESVPEGFELNAAGAEGTLGRNNRYSTAEFVNTYSVQGELQLGAEVSLEGRDPEVGGFTFELADSEGKIISRGVNDARGKVLFPKIRLTGADMVDGGGNPVGTKNFDYTVKQVIPGSPEKGFTYDEHAVTASVSVMDNGEGTLLFNVTYTGDTVFRNVYQAPVYPVTVSDDGSGTGSASPVSGTAGTNVTLTATPKPGYRFKEWQVISGGVSIEGDKFTLGTENAEIKAIFEWIPVYTATINGDSVWTKDSGAALTVTAKRGEADDTCFSHFIGVEIDGTALASGDYEAKAGSTVVTLKASVLQELSDGDHTVTVKFDDGAGSAEFTVKAAAVEDPVSPDTGDGIGPALCFALMGVSLLGFGVTFYCRKRKTDR